MGFSRKKNIQDHAVKDSSLFNVTMACNWLWVLVRGFCHTVVHLFNPKKTVEILWDDEIQKTTWQAECVLFLWLEPSIHLQPAWSSLMAFSLGRTPLMVAAASSLDDVRAPPSLGGNPDGVGPKVFFLHVYVQVFNQGYRTWIVTITYFHWAPDDWSRLGFIFRDVTLIPLEWSRFWKRVVLGMDISTPSIKPILSYLYDVYLVFLQICIRGSCNFTSCSSGCSSVMQLGSYPRKWCPIEKGLWMHTCAKLVLQKASQKYPQMMLLRS